MSEHLSQKLSARLHELGVVVESNYFYDEYGVLFERFEIEDAEMATHIPAPTFEELWAVMPWAISCGTTMYVKTLSTDSREVVTASYEYADWEESEFAYLKEIEHKSPTEALGLLAIWLAENGHLVTTS